MKNSILIILGLFISTLSFAQCFYDNTFYTTLTPATQGVPETNSCIWAGEYVTVDVTAGETYLFSTCNSINGGDTQITLFDATGTTTLASGDDECGVFSEITWVATFTGTVHVLVDEWQGLNPCMSGTTCYDISVTWLNSGPCIADQSVSAAQSTILCSGSTTIDLGSSETGVNYYLRNDADDSEIGSPIAGTGNGISFNTGGIPSTTTYNVYATNSGALDFDGVNDFVQCPNIFDPSATVFTVEAWFKYTGQAGSIIGQEVVTGNARYFLRTSGGKLVSAIGFGTTGILGGTTTMVVGQWYHGAVTYDGTEVKLYLNGVLEASVLTTAESETGGMQIGNNRSSQPYRGAIDEVRFWNVVKSESEIANDMNTCFTGTESNLVAYYQFDSGFGTSLTDLGPSNYDGVLTNMDPSTDWVDGIGNCTSCSTEMSQLVTVTVNPINDSPLTATDNVLCPSNSGTSITASNTQDGVDYVLRDDSDNSVIDGPLNGNGSNLTFNTGTLSSTTTFNVYGDISENNGAVYFDGGNDYAAIDINYYGNGVIPELSVEAWINTTYSGGTQTDNWSIIDFDASDYYNLYVQGDDGQLAFRTMHQGGAQWTLLSGVGNPVNDGQWHHVAVTFDGFDRIMYIDGVQVSSYTHATLQSIGTLTTSGQPRYGIIGDGSEANVYNGTRNNFYYQGAVDELRIWHLVRTATDIANYKDICLIGGEIGLEAYYKFNETSGNTIVDASGNGHNGEIFNTDGNERIAGPFQCVTCSQEMTQMVTVTVQDNPATVATVPSNISVNNDAGTCGAIVTYTDPTFDDDCDGNGLAGTLTSGLASGSTFPVGTTTVEYTYTDASLQTVTATFDVTVADNEDPTTPTLTALTGECSVTATAPTTTDNCAGTVTGTTTDPLSYAGQGSYTINWTYDDGNGNTSTQTQTVIVDDVTAPVADVASLPIATGECSATVTAPTATDNCVGSVTGTTTDPLTYTSEGSYTVTWTYDDGNGNTSTQTQTVIVDDVTAPIVDLATLPNITSECEVVSLTVPTATDNCVGSINGTHNATLPITAQGTTVVTWTYDDGNGNVTTQTQNIVIDDVTAPVADAASLTTVTGECTATVTGAPTATDNCVGSVTGTTTDPLTYTGEGTYTVTWTFDDGNGNTSTQTQTVVIDDVTGPVADLASLPNATGECSVTVTAPTATDNCVGSVTGTTTDPLTYTSEGTYTVNWTYDDGNGNTSSQTQTVIVDDVTAPVADVASLPNATGECSATVTAPTATDNCAGSITGTTTDPLTYTSEGTYTVTWTYDDGNGNTSIQTQTVIVDDVTAPVADVASLPTASGECSATVTAPTATDNCVGSVTGTTTDPLTYTSEGTYTVNWTYDDGNGNTSTQTQTVIVDDVTAPVADVASLPNITSECEVVSLTVPTATDNCVGSINGTHNATLPITAQGTTVVTWTYDDGNGNVTTQTQNIVIDDVTAPVADAASLTTVTGECTATVTGAPTATDNCVGSVTGTTTDPLTYTGEGTYTVTWTFDDGNGNTSTQTQTVEIDDVTAPVADLASLPNATGECSVTVTAPTATDNCVGSVTGTTTDPLTYTAEGTYTVNWTYDDGNGNTSSQTQTVIVDDVTAPVADLASLPTVTGECSATVTAPTATDNCVGSVTGTTTDPLTYTSEGTYTVTWTYDDGNGNISTQTQTVVVDDVTAPVADVASLPTETGECSATVSAPTATDNCVGPVTGTTTDPLTYTSEGTYTVTWTYDDGNGNTSTQTQTVIVDDVTAPVADVATLPNITSECEVVSLTVPTASDNCVGSINGTHNATLPITVQGTTVVTWTFDDGNGNTSTQTQNIVIDDVTAPVADAASLTTVTGECTATVTGVPTATDNCVGSVTGTTTDPLTYTSEGTYTVTWTFDDGNGNTSTQTQTVVINDVTAPVADVATLADELGECSATPTAPTATDNCMGTITGTPDVTFPITAQGTTVVTWTYDDGNGNTSTQTQNVILTDVTAPVPDAASLADVTDPCSVTSLIAPTATDNCSAVTVTNDATFPITATTTVTWLFSDASGNASTQTQNVIITDATAPTASNLTGATVECVGDIPAPDATLVNDATDNCTAVPTVTWTSDVSDGQSCPETITRTYTVSDDAGNTFDVTQVFIVQDITAPTASNPSTLTVQCIDNVPAPSTSWVNDEADNCSIPTVTWVSDVSDGQSCPETITRTFNVADDCGNNIDVVQLIVVNDLAAPIADAAALPTETAYCDVTLTAPTATDNCSGSITGTTTTTFPINTLGTTTVTWTFTDNCGNSSTQTQDVVIEQMETGTWIANDGITIVSSNLEPGVTYQWINCADDQPINGATNHNYTPTAGGDFAVVTTIAGCSDTSDCVHSVVGIKDLTTTDIQIYPNPTNDGIMFINYDGQINAIEVMDMTGRKVSSSVVIENNKIDASKLSMGNYLIHISTNEGVVVKEVTIVR